MFRKSIKIDKWIAKTTNRKQGTCSKSIKLGNRSIAALSFNVKSDSPYWRAGFKLCSPNSSDLNLLNQDSLLFHVGAKKEHDTMLVTVYINGQLKKNERLEYAKDSEITIAFEINENNFITCLIKDVQVFYEEVDPAIFKKIYLLAWGDKDKQDEDFRQYKVVFSRIIGSYRNMEHNTENYKNFLEKYKNKILNNKISATGVLIFSMLACIIPLINESLDFGDRFFSKSKNNSNSSIENGETTINGATPEITNELLEISKMIKKGRLDEAETLLRNFDKQSLNQTDLTNIQSVRAGIYMDRGKYPEAKAIYEAILDTNIKSNAVYTGLATIYAFEAFGLKTLNPEKSKELFYISNDFYYKAIDLDKRPQVLVFIYQGIYDNFRFLVDFFNIKSEANNLASYKKLFKETNLQAGYPFKTSELIELENKTTYTKNELQTLLKLKGLNFDICSLPDNVLITGYSFNVSDPANPFVKITYSVEAEK